DVATLSGIDAAGHEAGQLEEVGEVQRAIGLVTGVGRAVNIADLPVIVVEDGAFETDTQAIGVDGVAVVTRTALKPAGTRQLVLAVGYAGTDRVRIAADRTARESTRRRVLNDLVVQAVRQDEAVRILDGGGQEVDRIEIQPLVRGAVG